MAAAETIALLEQCFTEEALRRMCRKAGVLSIARKSDLSLKKQIRSVALLMLRNVCSKAVIFLEHKRIKTLDTDIVDRSLKALAVKMPFYISEPSDVKPCKTYKKERTSKFRVPAKKGSAATLERDYEQKNNGDCFYCTRAAFVKLTKHVLDSTRAAEHIEFIEGHLRMSQRALNLLQLVMERLITMLLFMAQYLLTEYSKGHGTVSKQVTLNGRGFVSVVHLLRGDMSAELQRVMPHVAIFADLESTWWPVLVGTLQDVPHEGPGRRGGAAPGAPRARGGGASRGRGRSRGSGSPGARDTSKGRGSGSRGRGAGDVAPRGRSASRGRGVVKATAKSKATAYGRPWQNNG